MLLPKGPDTIDKLDLDQNEKLDPDQSEKLDPDPFKLKWIRIPELRSLVLNYIQHLTSKSLGSGSGLFFKTNPDNFKI